MDKKESEEIGKDYGEESGSEGGTGGVEQGFSFFVY